MESSEHSGYLGTKSFVVPTFQGHFCLLWSCYLAWRALGHNSGQCWYTISHWNIFMLIAILVLVVTSDERLPTQNPGTDLDYLPLAVEELRFGSLWRQAECN